MVAVAALLVALLALLQVQTLFSVGPGSTYDASSSVTIFRSAAIITIAFFGLTFLTRWFAIPGMVTSLFGLLATGTYLLGPGSSAGTLTSATLLIACLGFGVALVTGVMILRSPRRKKDQ
jgi:hypothetical protein